METIYMAVHQTFPADHGHNGCKVVFTKDPVEVARLFHNENWYVFKMTGLQPVTAADVRLTVGE